MAASYAFGIAKNHPFVDGNKMVAIAAVGVFLGINGYEFKASEPELAVKTLQLAAREISEESS